MNADRAARNVFGGLKRALWNDPTKRRMTEQMPIIDDRVAQKILDLAMRVAEIMLSIGASAKEVTLAALRITHAYGLKSVHVDVTFNSVVLSDHRGGTGDPITLMRVVRSAAPDHAKLQRMQALVNDIEAGMPLADATTEFHTIRRIPFRYRPTVVVLAQAMLGLAVALMYGASWFTTLLALVASLAVALTQQGLSKLRIPLFFNQAAGALVLVAFVVLVTWIGWQGVPLFDSVRPTVLMASGIVLMLAGLAVVGATQDAIDGFALTAGGRLLDLAVMTMGLVVGILVGLEAARRMGLGLPLPSDIVAFGGPLGHAIGSLLIAIAVALINGASTSIILVSGSLGLLGWGGWYVLATLLGMPSFAGVFGGALIASFVGSVVADRLAVPSIAVTTAAMVPMVPGTAVFRGLLGLVSVDGQVESFMHAFDSLFTAAMTGIALASGATLGLMVGAPLRLRLGDHTVAMRSKARPATAAGGTAAFEVVRTEPVEHELEETPVADTADPHPLTKPHEAGE